MSFMESQLAPAPHRLSGLNEWGHFYW